MVTKTKDLNKCYGCFACANICPQSCITLEKDQEGFFMPKIDEEKCTNCGLCDKVCIIGKESKDFVKHKNKPACYYGWLKDDKLRKASASGGAAYAFSANCINQDGCVYGVVGKWFEKVHHTKAESIDELEQMQGSKYVQSYIDDSYTKVKEDLKKGKQVLFTGTPCQIAGLYSYLGKDYDNLLTVDLMCHGVPSQKVLLAEMAQMEKQNGKIKWLGRSGKYQFSPSQYIVEYENGKEQIIDETGMFFRQAFVANLIQRKSCNDCAFSKIPRVADITVGDQFMGFGNKPLTVMDPQNIGVSTMVVNSHKGECAMKQAQNILEYHPMTLARAILSHNTLAQGIVESPMREEFFSFFNENGLEDSKQLIEKAYSDWKRNKIQQSKQYRQSLKRNPLLLAKTVINKIVEKFL